MSEPPLDRLTTEAAHPQSAALDRMSALEIVRLMNAEDRVVVDAVGAQATAIAAAIDAVAGRLAGGGRLVYAGAGTSGRLGVLDAAECPPTFDTPPGLVQAVIAGGEPAFVRAVEGAEDSRELGAADLRDRGVGAADAVVGIAASGRTPYVLGAMAQARAAGAVVVGLSCNAGSPVERAADLPITVVVGPEVLSGSTRLKAGTATKMVLNMISTGAMVALGKTYGNRMVDLQATNEKLARRTRRILCDVSGLDEAAAEALLRACGGELKTAIVAARLRIEPDAARRRLAAAGGRVREALGGAAR